MNWDRIEGSWKQYVGKVQEQWGKLTGEDLEIIRGKREQLIGKLQERHGYAKDEAQRQVDDFYRALREEEEARELQTATKSRARRAGR
jgi:uncharacterized protein YjbJ (UPF0337 family)